MESSNQKHITLVEVLEVELAKLFGKETSVVAQLFRHRSANMKVQGSILGHGEYPSRVIANQMPCW